MPVSDEAAESISALLPLRSWIKHYVDHAYSVTTAPLIYHYGVGVSILAATCPSDLTTSYGMPLIANNYCLLAGRSSHEQKTTALKIGGAILDEAAPKLTCGNPGSKEGLFDSLATTSRQFLRIDEFGDLLASTMQGYAKPIKSFLTDCYDGSKIDRLKAKSKENVGRLVTVNKPRLSIGAGCSIGYLEKYTLAEDWTGGFLVRWMVLYGERVRDVPIPRPDPVSTRRKWLVDQLKIRADRAAQYDQQLGGPKVRPCAGIQPGSPEEQAFEDWYKKIRKLPLPSKIEGISTRAPALALRVALILSWDYGPPAYNFEDPGSFYLTMDLLQPAMRLVELHLESLIGLADILAEHPTARLRRSIMKVVQEAPGQYAALSDITRSLQLDKRAITSLVETLVTEKQLTPLHTSRGSPTFGYSKVYPPDPIDSELSPSGVPMNLLKPLDE